VTHTVTGRLNKPARKHANQSGNGVTFFADIGERNYNRKTQQKEWTNYSVALFAKDNQVGFYETALVEGAIVSVTGTGLLIDMPTDPQYSPRLQLIDSKLVFVSGGAVGAPAAVQQQVGMAPQQQAPQQMAQPQGAPAAQGFDNFDSDIPF